MTFSCQKGEFDRFFNRLDRPVEESRPDRQPDRFPSLKRSKDKVNLMMIAFLVTDIISKRNQHAKQ